MSRNPDRHSIRNAQRLVKGAMNATSRAAIRHGRQTDVALRLEHLVQRALREAARQLAFAHRDAVAAKARGKASRRAA
jgi:hypothetical protein